MEVLQDTYTKIGLNLEILNGFPAKSTFFNNENKGLPLIRIRNILKGHSETYYSGEFDSKYLIKNGDILIGMDGDFNIAKWTGIPSILNQRICKLIDAKDPFSLEYLYYYLEVELKKIQARTPSTTVKHLSIKDLRKVNAYCPPLPEQQKIAAILSTVDELISTTDKIVEKSKELKKGLMQKLFSEGIGHTEFKDTKIGRIPKDWEVVKLGNTTLKIKDGTHGTHKDFDGGLPLLSAKDIRNGIVNIPSDCRKISIQDYESIHRNFQLLDEDILLTVVGTIGRVAILKNYNSNFTFQRSVAYIRLSGDTNPAFYVQYFLSKEFTKQLLMRANASAQAGVYLGELSKIPIPIPSLQEQQKIADILSEADAKIEKEQTQKGQLEALKKGLMQQLLTGKKRVKV